MPGKDTPRRSHMRPGICALPGNSFQCGKFFLRRSPNTLRKRWAPRKNGAPFLRESPESPFSFLFPLRHGKPMLLYRSCPRPSRCHHSRIPRHFSLLGTSLSRQDPGERSSSIPPRRGHQFYRIFPGRPPEDPYLRARGKPPHPLFLGRSPSLCHGTPQSSPGNGNSLR